MSLVNRLLLLLPVAALFASCSEDFEVAAPYKPVTVVYGLLNAGDTAHYIRIQKAFLDERKSAIDMARVADSNFYGSLSVHLKEFNGGVLLTDETLPRVDLNNENFPKDTGAFFNAPNYAYKSKRILIPGRTYRLVVSNATTGEVDSAETPIIDNTASAPPQGFIVPRFNSSYVLSFPAIRETDQYSLDVSVPNHAQIFEGIIRFHYVDKSGALELDKFVDWRFATVERKGTDRAVLLTTSQRSFYTFLRDNIGTAPAGVERYLDSADLFVWGGGVDLANYQRINGAQGGITADQIKPLFTNIRGKNALGLLSTRARVQYYGVGINDITLDSLMKSPVTISLNIRGRSDH